MGDAHSVALTRIEEALRDISSRLASVEFQIANWKQRDKSLFKIISSAAAAFLAGYILHCFHIPSLP